MIKPREHSAEISSRLGGKSSWISRVRSAVSASARDLRLSGLRPGHATARGPLRFHSPVVPGPRAVWSRGSGSRAACLWVLWSSPGASVLCEWGHARLTAEVASHGNGSRESNGFPRGTSHGFPHGCPIYRGVVILALNVRAVRHCVLVAETSGDAGVVATAPGSLLSLFHTEVLPLEDA